MLIKNIENKPNRDQIPSILYGTAWKESNTQALTFQALSAGFKGIDTANQRKHYFEEGVGFGIQQFLNESGKTRQDLFLQTKFTSAAGQDYRKPYNEQDTFENQVKQSFVSSLEHLQTDYIDSFILHGPQYTHGLAEADWEIWEAMTNLFHARQVKWLGVSNINLNQLEALYKGVSVKPTFVQNRCFAAMMWDHEIRQFCISNGIIYQGFSLLTANQRYISNPIIQSLAQKYEISIPQLIFSFAQEIGILPLTGTTSLTHMHDDLSLKTIHLTADELCQIEFVAES